MGDLITPPEAAQILNFSEQWVTTLLRKGELKGQKVGQRWVIDRDEVLAYKAQKNADVQEQPQDNPT